jgi:hypothetical protein
MGRILRNYKNILSKISANMNCKYFNIGHKSHKKPCKICGHKIYCFVLELAMWLTQIMV